MTGMLSQEKDVPGVSAAMPSAESFPFEVLKRNARYRGRQLSYKYRQTPGRSWPPGRPRPSRDDCKVQETHGLPSHDLLIACAEPHYRFVNYRHDRFFHRRRRRPGCISRPGVAAFVTASCNTRKKEYRRRHQCYTGYPKPRAGEFPFMLGWHAKPNTTARISPCSPLTRRIGTWSGSIAGAVLLALALRAGKIGRRGICSRSSSARMFALTKSICAHPAPPGPSASPSPSTRR